MKKKILLGGGILLGVLALSTFFLLRRLNINYYKDLKKKPIKFISYPDTLKKYPSVIVIEDDQYKDEYLELLLNDSINTSNFPSYGGLHPGDKVYVIDYSSDSNLVEVVFLNNGELRFQPYHNRYWVWKNFLTDSREQEIKHWGERYIPGFPE